MASAWLEEAALDALPASLPGSSRVCRAAVLSLATVAVDLTGPGTSGPFAASCSFPVPCDAEGMLECAACSPPLPCLAPVPGALGVIAAGAGATAIPPGTAAAEYGALAATGAVAGAANGALAAAVAGAGMGARVSGVLATDAAECGELAATVAGTGTGRISC